MSSPDTPRPRPGRRVVLLAGAGLVALLVLVGVLVATAGDDDGSSAPAASGASSSASAGTSAPVTPSVVPTNPPTPEPSGPTSDAASGPSSLAPVGLDDEAEVGDGVRGRLVSVEAIQGDGDGVGAIDGPALRVTVELTNDTGSDVSTGAVAVELYTGEDLVPASPLNDPSEFPFQGVLAPGEQATGVYVFTVAEDDRTDVTVQVGYQAGAPYLVFRGDAS